MECYVCGFPRPEGAKYCPGCGRYCADDPNVKKTLPTPPEDLMLDESSIPESPVPEGIIPDATSIAVTSGEPEQVITEEPVIPVKQKKHRPVLIPVLIMALLFTVGTACWFLIPRNRPTSDTPPATTAPSDNNQPSTPPTQPKETRPNIDNSANRERYEPTDDRCFQMDHGMVSFIPERYDGNPILVIPSEINGETVVGIAPGGFSELEDVTTLVLPDTLKSIGDFAFANCKKLRGVYIPDSVNTIASGAFAGCVDLESVSIPAETTEIGYCAFDNCASLMYIFYEGTFEEWEALYDEYITPFTFTICSDGEYYHGTVTP